MTLNIFTVINIWSRTKQPHVKIGEVKSNYFRFRIFQLEYRSNVLIQIMILLNQQTHLYYAPMIFILVRLMG